MLDTFLENVERQPLTCLIIQAKAVRVDTDRRRAFLLAYAPHIDTRDGQQSRLPLYLPEPSQRRQDPIRASTESLKKALGAYHTSTLDTVNDLGNLYKVPGWLSEAESMYIRALQGKERTLGADHMSTLSAVNNLGNLRLPRPALRHRGHAPATTARP